MTRPLRFRPATRLALIPLIAVSLAMPVFAQEGPTGALDLPSNPTIFGKNDPNH
ncbi:MAG: hypothetical protein GXC70_04495, partial [Sphingomonadaceae bacterium]|nr:hypothetical protein [Sphingomonadaceae bacterium]